MKRYLYTTLALAGACVATAALVRPVKVSPHDILELRASANVAEQQSGRMSVKTNAAAETPYLFIEDFESVPNLSPYPLPRGGPLHLHRGMTRVIGSVRRWECPAQISRSPARRELNMPS